MCFFFVQIVQTHFVIIVPSFSLATNPCMLPSSMHVFNELKNFENSELICYENVRCSQLYDYDLELNLPRLSFCGKSHRTFLSIVQMFLFS